MEAARVFVLLFLPCVFIAPAQVLAATDSVVATDGQERLIANMNSPSFIYIDGEPGRSYCCEIHETFNSNIFSSTFAKFESVSSLVGFGATPVPSVARGKTSPRVVTFGGHPAADSARRCFIPTGNADYFQFMASFGPVGATNNNANITVRCEETTLFGGFNTSITDFNFLEIRNTSNSTINGSVTVTDAISDTTIINGQTFSVAAGDRVDINLHEPAGPGKFGPVVVTHDGPYGSLQAQVSQYNLVTVVPLDFAPVAQEVLRPRR